MASSSSKCSRPVAGFLFDQLAHCVNKLQHIVLLLGGIKLCVLVGCHRERGRHGGKEGGIWCDTGH